MDSTKVLFYNQTAYVPERQKLHNLIIDTILKQTNGGVEDPIAIILGGGSACGKSTIGERYLKDLKSQGKKAVYIDCDAIKVLIPEYKVYQEADPVRAATLVHDESSDIAQMVLDKAINGRYDIFYDGTMKNKGKYTELIYQLKENGYEVFAVVVDVPLEIAYQRAADRFLITKRMVNQSDIIDSHRGVAETFMQLKELFDGYAVWDNSEYGGEGEIIAQKDESGEKIDNRVRLDQFYLKSGIKIS